MNIGIGIPSPDWVNPTFAFDNLPAIIAYTKKNLKGLDRLELMYQQGVRTDRNRNIILDQFITKSSIDYLLWLDTDMLYPHNIIVEYMRHEFDIIGCLYFKKSYPYEAVGYVSGSKKGKFRALDPRKIKKDTVYTVAGLGYGGMMVNMKVYNKMGDDKWTKYSDDFHMPRDVGQITHDLVFCENAKKYGFTIKMHGGIRPGHVGQGVTTMNDWLRAHNERTAKKETTTEPKRPDTLVIIPSTDKKKAEQAAATLGEKAGIGCDIDVVMDKDKQGFVSIVNRKVESNPDYAYYVYVAQDAFPGRDWLKRGIETLEKEDKGVLAFNDGKWDGQLASFGLVSRRYIETYGYQKKYFFYPKYHSHYADTELTEHAKIYDELAYNPEATLIEVDHDKHGVNQQDRMLFMKRNPDSAFS